MKPTSTPKTYLSPLSSLTIASILLSTRSLSILSFRGKGIAKIAKIPAYAAVLNCSRFGSSWCHYRLDRFMAGSFNPLSASVSTAALPPRTNKTQTNNGCHPERQNGPNDNRRYLASRNGIILPWAEIYKQYQNQLENVDQSSPCSKPSPLDANTLLQLLPRGAYTTCRTIHNGTKIYQFDYHVRRLARSSRSILESIYVAAGENDSSFDSSQRNSSKVIASQDSGSPSHTHPKSHARNPSKAEICDLKVINESWERDMALECIRSTLDGFRTCYNIVDDGKSENTSNKVEFRMTLLATWEKVDNPQLSSQNKNQNSLRCKHMQGESHFESALYCHVGILPQSLFSQSSKREIRVLIHGHGRQNALAKDSKWVSDRKKYTTDIRLPSSSSNAENETNADLPSYEEFILINDSGEMLEGTQTNFYVVKGAASVSAPSSSQTRNQNPVIITANEGVLHGSVRDSVLRVCHSHDINIEFRPPTLTDLQHASGVFISSTSRWVMPVHEVVLGDLMSMNDQVDELKCGEKLSGRPSSFHYPNCETTENIRKWVLEDVETHCSPIY